MKGKKETNIIPARNYLLLFLLVALVVIVTFLFRKWYMINQNLNKEHTLISEFLVSINKQEFENYILENNNALIYLASSHDDTLQQFEIDFKEMMINYNLQEQMLYIDLDEMESDFIDNLKRNYLSPNLKNAELGKFTNILIMENGVINAILYNKETTINIEDVEEFFYNRGVIGQA